MRISERSSGRRAKLIFDQAARSEGVPGGNLTAVSFLGIELTAKRLELLRELVPATARVAVLVNPADVNVARSTLRATVRYPIRRAHSRTEIANLQTMTPEQ